MADIRPFRGLRYNQSLTGDLARVLCPPYDVISPQLQQELYARHEFNFVRLEYGREFPEDGVTNNRYTRSATTLDDWLRRGVIETDGTPAIYLHDHYFRFQGKDYRRRGMMVRVRLEEWDRMIVRPHEGTFAGPRRDRLDLLWALQANTSPVLSMFEDARREIGGLLDEAAAGPPAVDVTEEDGERHVVRAITAPRTLARITAGLADSPLYIADGHHRYSSALAYRQEKRSYSASAPAEGIPPAADEPFDFVMMTLVDIADPGLVILAPHRLVRGVPRPVLDDLRGRLETLFEVDEIPLGEPDLWRRVDEAAGGVRLTCLRAGYASLLMLRLREGADVGSMMPSFHTPLFQELDVSIVDHVVLENLLGIDVSAGDAGVSYNHDREDAVRRVLDEEYQLAFFLRPVRPRLVKTIADQGDQMPRKATYFYPKTPVGLVVHRLV